MSRLPDSVLEAFRKLLAPRPRVFVFPEIAGWAYCAHEVPKTHQVLVGMSFQLYDDVAASMFEEIGLHLRDYVELVECGGSEWVQHVVTERPYVAVSHDIPLPDSPYYQDILIRPVPLDVMEVKRI